MLSSQNVFCKNGFQPWKIRREEEATEEISSFLFEKVHFSLVHSRIVFE